MVGMTGFEPAAPSSRTKCATKLRYIPGALSFFILHQKNYLEHSQRIFLISVRFNFLVVVLGKLSSRTTILIGRL